MDILRFLYYNKIGRIIMKPLISRPVSELAEEAFIRKRLIFLAFSSLLFV